MSKALRLLIVDDEPDFRELLRIILDKRGYLVDVAESGEVAVRMIDSHHYDIVLTDMLMNGMNGMDVLKHIKSVSDEIACIIITAHASVENAVDAMRKGAFSYFIKSNNPQELIFDIEKIGKIKSLSDENNLLRQTFGQSEFVLSSRSPKFQKTVKFAEKVAETDSNVLILGESGVGKEVIARYIHLCSNRNKEIFMPVNCYSFSDSLLESELYGHEKGAFTGSVAMRKGRFEAADKGTLFLDEIGDIPQTTQTKILRNIENKEIERIGSNQVIKTDFRLISATNKNLKEAIVDRQFREDLYYRISTVIIEIPPLRERIEDLPILIEYFFDKAQKELKKRVDVVDPELMKVLMAYEYPGNVRELKNIIERLVVLAENGRVSLEDVQHYDVFSSKTQDESITSLKAIRQNAERNHIVKMLEQNDYDMDRTAKLLKISSRQLYNKVKEYNISLK